MEQKILKSGVQRISIKRLYVLLLFIVVSLVSAKASRVNPGSDEVKVTPMGVVNGEMTFRLNYDNAGGNKLEITVTDSDGNRLYRKVSTENVLNKTFKMDSEIETVYLTITNVKDNTQKKFKIISRQRIIERMIVASVE